MAEGSKIEPKWTKMEPNEVNYYVMLGAWVCYAWHLGRPWGLFGHPWDSLGALWGPGWPFTPILEHFWLHFGKQNGAKK